MRARRKQIARLFLPFLLLNWMAACADAFIAPDSAPSNHSIFAELWQEFDLIYPYFPHKQIDWDSVRAVYAARLTNDLPASEFADLLGEMVLSLRDGHANLITPFGTYSYAGWRKYTGSPQFFKFYTAPEPLARGRIVYGFAPLAASGGAGANSFNTGMGFLFVDTFADDADWLRSIDEIFDSKLPEKGGLLLDIRGNSGGSDRAMLHLAGRLADRKRVFAYVQSRNGPAHSDLTALTPRFVAPAGDSQFLKPAVVLVDGNNFSAAESFVLAMKALPHVTVLGDTTGGGSGKPIYRELSNGWTYSVSTWIERTPDDVIIENRGVEPDSLVLPYGANFINFQFAAVATLRQKMQQH